jgi:hypothetical protein
MVDLAAACRSARPGARVLLRALGSGELPALETWAALVGHAVSGCATTEQGLDVTVRVGALDSTAWRGQSRGDQRAALRDRLWIYTNFDCNLSCSYCCVRSSPHTAKRALSLATIQRLAAEARDLHVREVFLTGGEPFIRDDIAEVAGACAVVARTTILTNGMLFRGARLEALQRMTRDRVTLQVSLDSASAEAHDANRGAGSWARAVAGIRTARDLGFRVRVAATVSSAGAAAGLDALLDDLGVAEGDRLVRAVVERGLAAVGTALPIARPEVLPELTVTDRGIYFHPVAADDPDFLVTTELLPLARAFARVEERASIDQSHGERLASIFACA